MIWPLSETLTYIKPYLPGHLVFPPTFAHLQALAALLPKAMSAHYFETRLAADAPQVDFSTCIAAAQGGRAILTGLKGAIGLPSTLLENPLWRRTHDFFNYWADPASPLYEQAPLVWLEFDQVDGLIPDIPLPCVNVCVDPEYLKQHGSNRPHKQCYQTFIETTLELLLGQPLPAQICQNLISCFNLLPVGGKIIYVSAMLPRQPATLKLNGFIPKDQLLNYLNQIGWPGSVVEIRKIVAAYCASLENLRVDLTVGDHISSRIGLEFFSKGSTQPEVERQLLLNKFVENGLCSPEKREALLSWSGYSSEVFRNQAWTTKLNRTWYTKLVYQADQPLEAKGYLGFMPTFFAPFGGEFNV